MKFSCVAKDIEQALKNIIKVMPGIHSVNVVADSDIRIIGAYSGSYAEAVIKGKVEKKGAVTIPVKDLEGATKGRGQMTFTEKGSIQCVAGRYKAVLSPLPLDEFKRVTADKGVKFTVEMQNLLLEMITTSLVSDIDKGTKPPVVVNFSEKGTVVACVSRIHGVIATTKNLTLKSKTIYLQQDTFSSISSMSNKKAFKITFDETSIIGFNDDMLVSIPTYGEVQANWEVIQKMLKIVSNPDKQVELDGAAFSTAINNVLPFYENKSSIAITASKNTITLSASNGSAEIKEEIDCKGTLVNCKINPKLVAEMLGKSREKLNMGFASGNLVFDVKTKSARFFMLCACKS